MRRLWLALLGLYLLLGCCVLWPKPPVNTDPIIIRIPAKLKPTLKQLVRGNGADIRTWYNWLTAVQGGRIVSLAGKGDGCTKDCGPTVGPVGSGADWELDVNVLASLPVWEYHHGEDTLIMWGAKPLGMRQVVNWVGQLYRPPHRAVLDCTPHLIRPVIVEVTP